MSYTSGRLVAGQKTGVSTVASQLHPTQTCREVILQSDQTNEGADLLVGDANGQYITLQPSQCITIPVISLSLVYIRMSAGSIGVVNWIVRD